MFQTTAFTALESDPFSSSVFLPERQDCATFERAPSDPIHRVLYGEHGTSFDQEILSRPLPPEGIEAIPLAPAHSRGSSPSPVPQAPRSGSSSWTESRKASHSLSCRSKTKLTIAEKLAIAQDHECNRTPQAVLAARYGKSKSAISKILRPENIARLRSIHSVGVEASQSCCARTHNLELERRLHEFVEANLDDKQWRKQTRKRAGEIARELGVEGFVASKGWCNRFIKRHGFER
ncbi:hypothetical protein GUITHDRAFT_119067 [Guillardia theta CCMP2712]|uniref:HTH CENPB-type domain-containing protein n=2 Tax=Guillardia theta TaxID=55529 RepID=L1IEU8_GUITC|nr:hypothetical protein GUITHDRAFT_119067 [Guillardia theta CCMP2712]EKX34758.1 hypothetical protein GUITHDRAFT_119067 [Guillardia theta CCMP2712]|mmetsp:Transcript_34595/g.108448  ORF Transcript_34595/g.108448 Transcript_34595/m.108448 type:complete len:235 (+) Transcript_34595:229-933(+)|eukprot:XP_005821738.1 hypothetical protein GUITHDRAFT_119067 [Guillardia theta CCMP2712]